MIPLQYAPAQQEDIPAIFEMCKDLVERYEDPEAIDYSVVMAWLRKKIERYIHQYICVCLDDRKVAYYRLEAKDGQTELDDFYVLPEFRGRGIGSQILEKCCHETEMPIFLYVFIRNTGAIRLYQRHGFAVSEQVSPTRYIMTRHP